MLYKKLVRPLLFLLPAETAHHLIFAVMRMMQKIPGCISLIRRFNTPSARGAVTLAGIRFPSRVGLAAGLDKDAKAVEFLWALGFGFIEVGTVTPKPQSGNPKPRLFRLKKDQALINRMGFNNEGLEAMIKRLRKINPEIVVGGNIGKNKDTPNEHAVDDYVSCVRGLKGLVDYLVVNLSSPNTPGLRQLQEKEPLRLLLSSVIQENQLAGEDSVPVFLKVAPDITLDQANDILEIALELGIDGLIISNTTISREGLTLDSSQLDAIGAGGLSGKPLKAKATELLRYFKAKSPESLVLIASGGIMNEQDAMDKWEAGASLVQLYTGFVYEGSDLVKSINRTFSKSNFQ